MDTTNAFDTAPLSWVKGEIDLALDRAGEALDQLAAKHGDTTPARFCRTHLHQVAGAATIVGVEGIHRFAGALEALLATVETGARTADAPTLELARRGIDAIRGYFDDLLAGAPNRPQRLYPLYAELATACGKTATPADLFFPDLGVTPPRRGVAAAPPAPETLPAALRNARSRFQRGLLAWIKAPTDPGGLAAMREAVAAMESSQETPSGRAVWWIADGFLGALADGSVATDSEARQLCSRIDMQMRRLIDGARTSAERLTRDLLYRIATTASTDPVAVAVRTAYDLDGLLDATTPAPTTLPPGEAALRRLQESIASAEDAWGRFCTGAPESLAPFRVQAATVAEAAEALGHTDFRRLAQAILAAANWLAESPAHHSEAMAMEVATAILLAANAQENYTHLGGDFATQVDAMVARIHACIGGSEPAAGAALPALDAISREAQEKLLTSQVVREIKANLAQIEQVLDAFFREPARRGDIAGLDVPLRQIVGALTMMRQDGAVAALQKCAARIARFARSDYEPRPADFDAVAKELSALGFFVDALRHGNPAYAEFVAALTGEEAPRPAPSAVGEPTVAEPVPTPPEAPAPAAPEVLPTPGAAAAPEEAAADAELLGIFLEEAREVLTAIATQLEKLRIEPHDGETLNAVRRAFHTLKGSGRMVGLNNLGEAAWAVEQTLNAWLHRELPATPPLLAMIELGNALFTDWVRRLEGGVGPMPDASALIAQADALLAGTAAATQSAEAPPPEEVPPEEVPPEEVPPEEAPPEEAPPEEAPPEEAPPEEVPPEEAPPEEVPPEEVLPEEVLLEEVPPEEVPPEEVPPEEVPPEEVPPEEVPPEEVPPEVVPPEEVPPEEVPPEEVPPEEVPPEEVPPEEVPPEEVPPEEVPPEVVAVEALPAGEPRGRLTVSSTLYGIFIDEARGHLAALQNGFSDVEIEPGTPYPEEMSRAAHTLAGISSTLALEPIGHLAQALEQALLRQPGAEHADDLEALETVRLAIGALETMVERVADRETPEAVPNLAAALEATYPPRTTTPAAPAVETAGPAAALLAPAVETRTLLGDEFDSQLLPVFLEETGDLVPAIEAHLRSWREAPTETGALRALARELHTLKGSARMAGAMKLGELTHAIETRVDEAHHAGTANAALIEDIESAFDAIVRAIEQLQQQAGMPAPMPTAATTAAVAAAIPAGAAIPAEEAIGGRGLLRVRADLVDRLVNEAGELSIARTRVEGEIRQIKDSLLDLTENVARLRRQLREIEIEAETQMQSRQAEAEAQRESFDPLELDRFSRIQELTRMMAESVGDVATVQQGLLQNLDTAGAALLAQARLTREHSQALMSVRMVPLSSQVERLYRVVRQTARELGKRAHLEIVGGQTELDRSVLEQMLAPLEHMLRNAVTHGLETREARIAAGKPEIGEITLTAAQEGNEVVVTLADDGRGLDFETIRTHAIETGRLAADGKADDARLVDFIFEPGFSTARAVTQVAGRGVGMDVVRSEVAGLGGRIEVESAVGKGLTFRIYLPLTLAITQALLVRAGAGVYALPSSLIEQVQELKDESLATVRAAGEAEWLGRHYPYRFLPHLLGDADALPEMHRQYWLLLLKSGNQRAAVQVDELLGKQEIVVKNIGPQLARVVGITGATVLGDGRIVLIVNPVALAARTPARPVPPPAPEATPVEAEKAVTLPTVMVVDDSLTVRKITGRLLERQGYHVLTAKDGIDALEKMLDVVPDVLLADIEMPRMDGFDLVRNIRADERLRQVPVIVISSRTADKHRRYAAEVGADHFLGKPYQEDELLALVAGYVRKRW